MADTAQLPPPEAKEDDELKGSEAPLLDHLIELRKRLIYSLIAVVVFFLACFAFAKQIYDLLLLPFRLATMRLSSPLNGVTASKIEVVGNGLTAYNKASGAA